ncbi:MBL fold metallo-hydrolase [Desulfococcaceae bacterium HSG8]|nr:MBL fold metallo-hydrolase [Desulfococcaceae bacterium HSG8]
MKVVIWGSRGSLPASVHAENIRYKIYRAIEAARGHDLRSKEHIENFIDTELPFSVRGGYGTNTSCVEIRDGEDYIILDSGSGIRDFGNYVMKTGKIPATYHIFMSHVHWDHICGFPFFVPAYIKGNRLNFYGFHDVHAVEQAFANQQEPPCFPVPLQYMQAERHFTQLKLGKTYDIAGFRVSGIEQNHPQLSYGYSFEKAGKKIIYSTDSEHKEDSSKEDYHFVKFFKNADMLIFDTQYSLMDAIYVKEDWGHSSNIIAVELSVRAGVKHLCMFHSEHTHSDANIDKMLKETKRYASIYDKSYPLRISHAYDGLEIEI